MTRTNRQIGLPVAEAFAAIDDGRTVLDRDLVGNDAASVASAIPFAPCLPAQGATGTAIGVDALTKGFVADSELSLHSRSVNRRSISRSGHQSKQHCHMPPYAPGFQESA